jgi:hypothetical protein
VDPSHRRQVDERRAEDESGRRVLARELGHHRRAKALAVVQEARRRHLGLLDQEPVGRANIAGEPLLARSPRVASVAGVVEQQHRQTRARQRARQRRSLRPVAGVSVCHQHRDATVRLAGLDQPRAQRQAVDGLRRHLPCAGDQRLRPRQLRREGKVDEAALESDEHASIHASVCRSPDLASARTPIRRLRMSRFAGKLSFRHPQPATESNLDLCATAQVSPPLFRSEAKGALAGLCAVRLRPQRLRRRCSRHHLRDRVKLLDGLEVLRSQSWTIYAGARAKGAGARAKSRYPYAEAILEGRERKAKTTSPVEVDAAFPLQEGRILVISSPTFCSRVGRYPPLQRRDHSIQVDAD